MKSQKYRIELDKQGYASGTQYYRVTKRTRFGFSITVASWLGSIDECEQWIHNLERLKEVNKRLEEDTK